MKYKYYIVAGIIILLGIFLLTRGKSTDNTPPPKQTIVLPKEIAVNLDDNGFSPKEITIKVGTAVRWKNTSNKPQTVNSDNYPTNQLHKELNFGVFTSGSSVVYIFTKPGTYGYHNQFHNKQAGKVIVTN